MHNLLPRRAGISPEETPQVSQPSQTLCSATHPAASSARPTLLGRSPLFSGRAIDPPKGRHSRAAQALQEPCPGPAECTAPFLTVSPLPPAAGARSAAPARQHRSSTARRRPSRSRQLGRCSPFFTANTGLFIYLFQPP